MSHGSTTVHATRPTSQEAEEVLARRCKAFEERNPMAIKGAKFCEGNPGHGSHCVQYYD